MAITYDNVGSTEATATSSISWSHTCAGDNRILVATVAGECFGPTISTATYNSVSRTAEIYDATVATYYHNGAVYWVAPATGANSIAITYTGAFDRVIGISVSYTGVDQTTPIGTAATATGTSTTPSVTVSSASGELVVDRVTSQDYAQHTVGANQTSRAINIGAASPEGSVSEEAGASSVTMSWSLDASVLWYIGAVPIKPASSGSAYTPRSMLLGVG